MFGGMFIFVLGALLCGPLHARTLYEDETCTLSTGTTGICKQLTTCSALLDGIQSGTVSFSDLVHCSFVGSVEVVCCPYNKASIQIPLVDKNIVQSKPLITPPTPPTAPTLPAPVHSHTPDITLSPSAAYIDLTELLSKNQLLSPANELFNRDEAEWVIPSPPKAVNSLNNSNKVGSVDQALLDDIFGTETTTTRTKWSFPEALSRGNRNDRLQPVATAITSSRGSFSSQPSQNVLSSSWSFPNTVTPTSISGSELQDISFVPAQNSRNIWSFPDTSKNLNNAQTSPNYIPTTTLPVPNTSTANVTKLPGNRASFPVATETITSDEVRHLISDILSPRAQIDDPTDWVARSDPILAGL